MGKEALLGIHHKSRLRRNGRSDDRLGAVGFGPAVVQFPSLENPLHRPNASPPWSRARQQAVARGCDNRSLTVAAPGRLFSSSWVACKAIRYSVATPTRKPAPPAECVAAPEPRASGAVKKSPVERERRSRHASPLRTIVCFQRRRGLACQARLAGIGSPTFFHRAPQQAVARGCDNRSLRGREENLLSRRRAGAPSARQAQRCRTPPLPKPQLLRLDS